MITIKIARPDVSFILASSPSIKYPYRLTYCSIHLPKIVNNLTFTSPRLPSARLSSFPPSFASRVPSRTRKRLPMSILSLIFSSSTTLKTLSCESYPGERSIRRTFTDDDFPFDSAAFLAPVSALSSGSVSQLVSNLSLSRLCSFLTRWVYHSARG
jgi:hypothetical protein